MASKISRLSKAIAIAMLGLSLSGGNMPAVHASDADAELAALEAELAALESELAQEKGTIKEEKTKLKKEPNKLKLSGDARIKYTHAEYGANWYARGRIAMQHDINDKVSVYARWALMSDNPMGLSEHFSHKINTNYPNTRKVRTMYPDLNATDGSWVSDANMQVKKLLGADKFTLGRFGQTFGATGLYGDEDAFGGIDGAKFDWSGQAGSLTVGYAKFGASQKTPELNSFWSSDTSKRANAFGAAGGDMRYGALQRKPLEQALFVNGQLKLGPAVTLHGMWIKEMNNGSSRLVSAANAYAPWFFDNPDDHDIRGIGITAQITPNLKLVADYAINANDFTATLGKGQTSAANARKKYETYRYERQKAEYVSLRYKEAKWGDKGSFGINLDWRNIDPSVNIGGYADKNGDWTVVSNTLFNPLTMADELLASEGIKGPVFGINYMLTKNVKLTFMQTFANTFNWYNFYTEASGTKFYGYIDRINEKADNMTVVSLTAKF